MAYQCNSCGPGCGGGSSYSPHDYDGHGGGYETLDPQGKELDTYSGKSLYDDNDISGGYQANKEEEEKKKEEKNKKPTIEDNIKKEEKKEEKSDDFKKTADTLSNEFMHQNNDKAKPKKKKYNDIEEAIKKAVKKEQEIWRV